MAHHTTPHHTTRVFGLLLPAGVEHKQLFLLTQATLHSVQLQSVCKVVVVTDFYALAQTCLQAVPNLPLPAVVNDTVVVQHADMRCYASSTAAAAAAGASPDGSSGSSSDAGASPAAVWGQLEQLVAGGDMPSTNWLEGAKQVRCGLATCAVTLMSLRPAAVPCTCIGCWIVAQSAVGAVRHPHSAACARPDTLATV